MQSEPPSSSGLGHHPFKVAARVRIPLGVREMRVEDPLQPTLRVAIVCGGLDHVRRGFERSLAELDAKARAGQLQNRLGKVVTQSLEGGLVREDRRVV